MKTIQQFFLYGLLCNLLWVTQSSAQIFSCPQNWNLQNVTVNSLKIYRAQQQVTLSNFTVQGSNGNVKVFAGQSIELNPDTHIKAGSQGWMRISPCSTGSGGGGGGDANRTTHTSSLAIQSIQLHPNPTQGKVSIVVPTNGDKNEKQTLEVFTILGHLVLHRQVLPGEKVHIDLSKHPKGIYLIKHRTLQRVTIKRVIYQ